MGCLEVLEGRASKELATIQMKEASFLGVSFLPGWPFMQRSGKQKFRFQDFVIGNGIW